MAARPGAHSIYCPVLLTAALLPPPCCRSGFLLQNSQETTKLTGSKYCYFNRLVWGFCWCISTGDEHDFGLIVMATVAAVLVSPCEHRPGQAPAHEPWTGSGTAGSFFFFILFISVCLHVICVLKPFLGETSLASCWERGCQGKVGWAGARTRVSSRSWLVRTGLFPLTPGLARLRVCRTLLRIRAGPACTNSKVAPERRR